MKMTFTTKQFMNEVQHDLLVTIVMSLRHGRISEDKSQRLAKEFLIVKDSITLDEFVKKLAALIPEYHEAHEVYSKYAPRFYNDTTMNKLMHMRQYIETQEFEKALKVAHANMKIKKPRKEV